MGLPLYVICFFSLIAFNILSLVLGKCFYPSSHSTSPSVCRFLREVEEVGSWYINVDVLWQGSSSQVPGLPLLEG
jgi:hypothetical protein